jgi:hypothetical protein
MASNEKLVTKAVPFTFVLAFFSLAVISPGRAQTSPTDGAYLLKTSGESSDAALFPATKRQPLVAYSSALVPSQAGAASAADGWHLAVAPYLWFPGMHGTATGPNGRGLSFRASPGDLLSNFRFGLMGAVEARHKRIVMTGDMLWVRLEDDKAVPFSGLLATSATMKATEFFLTSKLGLRVVNEEKIKIDALAGMRYWHLGENLTFNPSTLGLNFDGSQNFVDPLVGGRIGAFLSPKVALNVLGDVGGWDTGSHLEYQWAGTLGYRVKPRWALHAGYRYLYIDKKADRGVVFNSTMSGVMFGVTIGLK